MAGLEISAVVFLLLWMTGFSFAHLVKVLLTNQLPIWASFPRSPVFGKCSKFCSKSATLGTPQILMCRDGALSFLKSTELTYGNTSENSNNYPFMAFYSL